MWTAFEPGPSRPARATMGPTRGGAQTRRAWAAPQTAKLEPELPPPRRVGVREGSRRRSLSSALLLRMLPLPLPLLLLLLSLAPRPLSWWGQRAPRIAPSPHAVGKEAFSVNNFAQCSFSLVKELMQTRSERQAVKRNTAPRRAQRLTAYCHC